MNEQTWLSLEELCGVLRTTQAHVQWLVENNFIEMLPGKSFQRARFLDPTPAYADRLRLSEMIYQRRHPLPEEIDLSEKAVFTRSELALILGWTDSYARRYLSDNDTPCVKIGKHRTAARLYTAQTIRGLLWRRSGYKVSAQRSPFLLRDFVEFFHRQDVEARKGIPSDADFREDALFQKKLKMILKMPRPRREAAMQELWQKVELAKQAAQTLASAASSSRSQR